MSAAVVTGPPEVPPKAALVLSVLVLGAVVANMNLSIANVALPTIGRDLGASQDQLTAIASAFTLALAASVLYLGAVGDRYGRKLLFVCGSALAIPTAAWAAWAPNVESLVLARFASGIAAGLMFPTTLSLVTALWHGPARTRAIAVWSGVGGGFAALGPLLGGWMLEHFWWGSVFLITVPLVVVTLVLGLIVLPWTAGEEVTPVDHLGGVLSIIGVAALVLTVERASRGLSPLFIGLMVTTVLALSAFVWRQRRAPHPLMDLDLAAARPFWVASVAGAVTFGSLIGAMFVGQQFTQNVLGYQPLEAALTVVPSAVLMMLAAGPAARMIAARGSRETFALGLLVVAMAFLVMLVTWRPGAALGWVLVTYALTGTGVGLCATPASRSLMSSLPVSRAGMGSAFVDLTRDFGGAIMQATMGALLAVTYAGYFARAFASLPPDQADRLGQDAAQQISSSYSGALEVAKGFPQADAQQLVAAAAKAFTEGQAAAVSVGLVLTLAALGLVWWKYPRRAEEEAFFARIAELDVDERVSS